MNYSIFLIFSLTIAIKAFGIEYPELDSDQLNWLGKQIYTNECRQQKDCLTSWNEGENFPSLGIGHFIWYQDNQEEIYTETFPGLLVFLKQKGVNLPAWLEADSQDSPWSSRDEFYADFQSERMQELRTLLFDNLDLQTEFILHRFSELVNEMAADESGNEQKKIIEQFENIAHSEPPLGIYALIDYVHFKGVGLSPNERYQNQGWGLKQVLENMKDNNSPLNAFVDSAKFVLQNRVENAPEERNESRWLRGWYNRLDTYLPESIKQ